MRTWKQGVIKINDIILGRKLQICNPLHILYNNPVIIIMLNRYSSSSRGISQFSTTGAATGTSIRYDREVLWMGSFTVLKYFFNPKNIYIFNLCSHIFHKSLSAQDGSYEHKNWNKNLCHFDTCHHFEGSWFHSLDKIVAHQLQK